MIYFKPLPSNDMDFTKWKTYIKNEWFLKHFMKFSYGLQVLLGLISIVLGVWNFANWIIRIIILIVVFIIHELLHILVVCKIGDIGVTHSGISLWISSNAIMSKIRYWLFITLPLIVLSIIPGLLSLINGFASEALKYTAWINAIIAGSDIINSILIAVQPSNAKFCKGYFSTEDQ